MNEHITFICQIRNFFNNNKKKTLFYFSRFSPILFKVAFQNIFQIYFLHLFLLLSKNKNMTFNHQTHESL